MEVDLPSEHPVSSEDVNTSSKSQNIDSVTDGGSSLGEQTTDSLTAQSSPPPFEEELTTPPQQYCDTLSSPGTIPERSPDEAESDVESEGWLLLMP